MFQDAERHQMKLARQHPNGAEEWVCPTCNRRFIMHWPPNYKRVILEEGNADAIHSGAKGGVQMGAPQTWSAESDSTVEDEQEEPILSPEMRTALNELDWGDWPS